MDGSIADQPWKPQPVTGGAWAGWGRYETDPYENLTGPFYSRRDPATGQMVCAFRAEAFGVRNRAPAWRLRGIRWNRSSSGGRGSASKTRR